MKIQRKWRRLREKALTASIESEKAQSSYSQLKRSVAMLAAASMIMQPVIGFASAIEGGGIFAPEIIQNEAGDVFDVNSQHHKGGNAFNSFNKFQLDQNHIANLNMGNSERLFNFVNSEINVGGVVNTLRDGKIGGNVYFLSKDGMVVNAGGAINTGAMHVITPTQGTIDKVFGSDASIHNDSDLAQAILSGTIPLTPDGSIIIKGNINVTNDIHLTSQHIMLDGAKLRTGVTDFSNLVNISTLPSGTVVDGLSIESDGGNIVLTAKGAERESILPGTVEADIRIINGSQLTAHKDISISSTAEQANGEFNPVVAKVVLDNSSRIEAGDNVSMEATASHKGDTKGGLLSQLKDQDKLGVLGELGLDFSDIIDAGAAYSSSTAQVDALGNIKAGEKVTLSAKSEVDSKLSVESGSGILVHVVENQALITVGGALQVNEVVIDAEAKTSLSSAVTANSEEMSLALGISTGTTESVVEVLAGSTIETNKEIKISATTQSEVSSSVTAGVKGESPVGAVALNVVNYNSAAAVKVNGSLNSTTGNVSINAKNVIKSNTISTKTVSEYEAEKTDPKDTSWLAKIKDSISKLGSDSSTEEAQDIAQGDTGSSGGGLSAFSAAGALAIANEKNEATIEIGGNINTTQDVKINAEIVIEDTHMTVNSGVAGGDAAALTASGGVLVSNMTNQALVSVADDVMIHGKGVQINSMVKMDVQRYKLFVSRVEALFDKLTGTDKETAKAILAKMKDFSMENLSDDEFTAELTELAGKLSDTLDEVKALKKDFGSLDAFANYSAQSNATNKNAKVGVAGSGTVSVNTVNNSSQVLIGDKAKLSGSAGDVSVSAETTSKVWNLGGVLGKKILGGVSADNGAAIGGTYTQQNLNSDAQVIVGKKAELSGKNINLSATNDVLNVSAALGSGKGSKGAMIGMVSVSNGDSEAKIEVKEGTKISASKDFNAAAKNTTTVTNIAGGFAQSDDVGVGIGVAVSDYDVRTQVLIGEKGAGKEKVQIQAQNVYATAATDGLINTISVAGGFAKNSEGKDDEKGEGSQNTTGGAGGILNQLKDLGGQVKEIQGLVDENASALKDLFAADSEGNSDVTNQFNKAPEEQKGEGGKKAKSGITPASGSEESFPISITGAGSLSVNLIDNKTNVEIANSDIQLGTDGRINAISKDQSWVGAWSGAAAISWSGNKNEGVGAAFSGAVALNNVQNKTTSLIEDSSIKNASSVNVWALSESNQVSAALGVQVAKVSAESSSATGGAAVSINLVDRTIDAKMKNVDLEGADSKKADVDVVAFQGDLQVAGGINANASNSNIGLGATVVVSDVKNKLSASIEGGKYRNVNDVKVEAVLATTQVAAAVSAGATTNANLGISLNGAFAINRLENDVKASIKGAEIEAANNVSVQAYDTRKSSSYAAKYIAQLDGAVSDKNSNYASSRKVITDGQEYYDDLNTNVMTAEEAQSGSGVGADVAKMGGHGDGAIIVTGAASGSLSTGNGAAAGAAVAVTDIRNNYSAEISSSDISALNVNVIGTSNTLVVNAAGGAAIATGSNGFAGMGSVAWQNLENTASAKINSSAIETNKLNVNAHNKSLIVNVAGQVSGGKQAAMGAAIAVNNLNNNAIASISDSTIDEMTDGIGTEIAVTGANDSTVVNIAASAGGSGEVAVMGSVSVNRVIGETSGSIDGSNLKNVKELQLTATDNGKLYGIAGAFSGAGTAAIGGAVSYNEIGNIASLSGSWLTPQKVTAKISDTIIQTKDNAKVDLVATNNVQIYALGAAAGGAGTVAVQGAATMNIINKDTQAILENVELNKDDKNKKATVNVLAQSKAEIDSLAVAIAGSGTGAGGAGIGGNTITENNKAIVSGGHYNVKDLEVRSHTEDRIVTIGASIAGSGQVGLAGSVTVNNITNNVTAGILGGAKVYADGSVGVSARTDNSIQNYAGAVGIGGGGGGAGLAVSVNDIGGDTKAEISGSDTEVSAEGNGDGIAVSRLNDGVVERDFENLDDYQSEIQKAVSGNRLADSSNFITEKKTGIIVDALSTNEINSYMATASGGLYVGASGTSATNVITGATTAQVDGAKLNTQNVKASDLNIHSADYLTGTSMVGAIAISAGGSAGAGVDTTVASRKTQAMVNGAGAQHVANINDLNVRAEARQGIVSVNVGVAGGSVAVAGTISTVILNSETSAQVSNFSADVVGDVDIRSYHGSDLHLANASLSVSAVGAGLAVGVINDNSKTKTKVVDSVFDLTEQGTIKIQAENKTAVSSLLGVMTKTSLGASGAITVSSYDAEVQTQVLNSNLGTDTNQAGAINISSKNTMDISNYLGNFGVGNVVGAASIAVNNVNNRVDTTISGSSLKATGDIDVSAWEERNFTQESASVAAGLAALNANVVVNNIGGKLEDVALDGKKASDSREEEVSDTGKNSSVYEQVAIAEKATDQGKLHQGNTLGMVSAEQTASINQATQTNDGKGSTDVGKSSSTKVNVSDSRIESGKNIHIQAKESGTTKIDMLTGSTAGVSGSGSVALMNVNRQLSVRVDQSTLTAGEQALISTDIAGENTITVYQGSVGAIALGGAYGKLKVQGDSSIRVVNSTIEGDDVTLTASDRSHAQVDAFSLTVGGAAVGGVVAIAENGSNSSIYSEDSKLIGERGVTVSANKENTVTAKATGGSAGLISGTGLDASAANEGISSIALDQTVARSTQGNVLISALSQNNVMADSIGGSIGFWASGAALAATATDKSSAKISIFGSKSEIQGNTVTIDSSLENTVEAQAVGGSAGTITGVGMVTTASNTGGSKVAISSADILVTNQLNIKALNKNKVMAQSASGSSGVISVGVINANANDASQNLIDITNAKLSSTNTEINGISQNTVTATVDSTSGNLAGVSAIKANAIASGSNEILLLSTTLMGLGDEVAASKVSIKTDVANTVDAGVATQSISVIGGGAVFIADAQDSSFSKVAVGDNNTILANTIELNAKNAPNVNAAAKGTGGGAVNLGVAKVLGNTSSQALLNIGKGNTLSGETVKFVASIEQQESENNVLVEGMTFGAGVVNVGVNSVDARSQTSAVIRMDEDNQFSSETELIVNAENNTSIAAKGDSTSAGFVALGSLDVNTHSENIATVSLAGSSQGVTTVKRLTVESNNNSKNETVGNHDKGGFVAVGKQEGANGLYAISAVTISGKWDVKGDADIQAEADVENTTSATTKNGGFVTASEIRGKSDTKSTVTIDFDGAAINANKLKSAVSSKATISGDFNSEDAGFITETYSKFENNVALEGKINIKNNSVLQTRAGQSHTVMNMIDVTSYDANAKAVNGVSAFAAITLNHTLQTIGEIFLEEGSALQDSGYFTKIDLSMNREITLNSNLVSTVDSGLYGDPKATINVSAGDSRQTIQIDGYIFGMNDVNLSIDKTSDTYSSKISGQLDANAQNYRFLGGAEAEVDGNLNSLSEINIGKTGEIFARKNVDLATYEVDSTGLNTHVRKYRWWKKSDLYDNVDNEQKIYAKYRVSGAEYIEVTGGERIPILDDKNNPTGEYETEEVYYFDWAIQDWSTTSTTRYKTKLGTGEKEQATLDGELLVTGGSTNKKQVIKSAGERNAVVNGSVIAGALGQLDIRLGGDGTVLDDGALPILEVRSAKTGEWEIWDLSKLGAKIENGVILLPDLESEGGNITITAKSLTGDGTGKLEARGAQRISVENNTNLDITINSALINNASGGTIKWNQNVPIEGKIGSTVQVVSNSSLGGDDRQGIYLTSNWSPYLEEASGANFQVNGKLENKDGKVQILNKDGNVSVADIKAGDIDIEVWHGNYVQNASSDVILSGKSKIIASGDVTIIGKKIKNDGYIQSGIAEYSVRDDDWKAKIAAIVASYDDSELTNEEVMKYSGYKLNKGGLVKDESTGAYSYEDQAYYNPFTGEIFTEDMIAHGGQINLTGTDISGDGRIRALSGMETANIATSSEKELHVGRVEMTKIDGKIIINGVTYQNYKDRAVQTHNGSLDINFIGVKDADIEIAAEGSVVLEGNIYGNGADAKAKVTSTNGNIVQVAGIVKINELTLNSQTGQVFDKENQVNKLNTQNTGANGDIIFNNKGTNGLVIDFTEEKVKDGKVVITNAQADLTVVSGIDATDGIVLTNSGEDIVVAGELISDETIKVDTNNGTIALDGDISAKKDITITSKSTTDGSIVIGGSMTSDSGDVFVDTTTGDIFNKGAITVVDGSLKVTTGMGEITHKEAINVSGDVQIQTGAGNITNEKDIISSTDGVTIETADGYVDNKGKVLAEKDIWVASHGIGNVIQHGDVVSNIGSVTMKTGEGNILTGGNVKGQEDVEIAVYVKGDIQVDKNVTSTHGEVNIWTNKGTISTQGTISADQGIEIKSGEGAITNKENLTAKNGNISIETGIGSITNKKDLTAVNGSIIIKNQEDDILNLGTLWAAEDVDIYAESGDITTYEAVGKNIYAELADESKKIDFERIGVDDLISLIGNDMNVDYVWQLPGHDHMLTVRLKSVGDRTPIRDVTFDYLDVPNGVIFDGLWADRAYIHVQAEKFYLPQLKISQYGYFSNKHAKAKVYGAEPWQDNDRDIIVWNDATWYSPRIDFFFDGGKKTTGTGPLLVNRDYFRHYNERYSQVRFSGMAQYYLDAGLMFLAEDEKSGNSYLDARIIEDAVIANEEVVQKAVTVLH